MNNAHEQKLEHIISRMQNDRSVDAPVDALKYAKNLFKVQAAEPSLLTRVIAVLKAELEPNRAVFGERSAPGGTARQMLFDAGVMTQSRQDSRRYQFSLNTVMNSLPARSR